MKVFNKCFLSLLLEVLRLVPMVRQDDSPKVLFFDKIINKMRLGKL